MGVERRVNPRVAEDMKFALQGGPLPHGTVAEGQIVDLSEGGAAFETSAAIPDGQVITFELRLPIHVQAKIVRQEHKGQKYRYGMLFQTVEWLDRETLRKYIGKRLGKI